MWKFPSNQKHSLSSLFPSALVLCICQHSGVSSLSSTCSCAVRNNLDWQKTHSQKGCCRAPCTNQGIVPHADHRRKCSLSGLGGNERRFSLCSSPEGGGAQEGWFTLSQGLAWLLSQSGSFRPLHKAQSSGCPRGAAD